MYGMHFYRVKGRPGCNPLWVSIGLMGLQEWTFKDDSTSTDSTHTNNDIRIPTSISVSLIIHVSLFLVSSKIVEIHCSTRNKLGTAQVDAPLKVHKNQIF